MNKRLLLIVTLCTIILPTAIIKAMRRAGPAAGYSGTQLQERRKQFDAIHAEFTTMLDNGNFDGATKMIQTAKTIAQDLKDKGHMPLAEQWKSELIKWTHELATERLAYEASVATAQQQEERRQKEKAQLEAARLKQERERLKKQIDQERRLREQKEKQDREHHTKEKNEGLEREHRAKEDAKRRLAESLSTGDKDQFIEELLKQQDELTRELDAGKKTQNNMKGELEALNQSKNNESARLQQALQNAHNELEDRRQMTLAYETQSKSDQEQIKELKLKLAHQRQAGSSAHSQTANLEQIKKELDAALTRESGLATLSTNKKQDWDNERHTLKDTIDHLQKNAQTSAAQITDLQRERRSAQEQVERLGRQLVKAEIDATETYKQEIQKLQKQIADLDKDKLKLASSLKHEAESHEQLLQDLEDKHKEISAKNGTEHFQLQNKAKQLENKLAKQEEDIKAANKAIENAEDAAKEVPLLRKIIDDQKNEIDQLQTNLKVLKPEPHNF